MQESIVESLGKYPVVGLLGSRQVGKTTLAKTLQANCERKVIYLDLELPSDFNKLQEPELYLKQFENDLVIIDEIQRMPSLFPLLRAMVDQTRSVGRFLLLGSASPALIKQASESLAGRIIYHELTPLTLEETGYEFLQKLWLRGGYPASFLSENDGDSYSWREAFIRTYLEMDIPQLGIRVPAMQLRKFWIMLAHSHGQLWNASRIANSLGISAPTVRSYLDILGETYISRQLPPYFVNVKKRLIKSPKVYLRDTGLLHALAGVRDFDGLQNHPAVGSSWEGFIIEQIIGQLPQGWSPYFYRTSAGAEVDLILIAPGKNPTAVEIKYSLSPKVSKGFRMACEDLACDRAFIVYPGEEAYPLDDKIMVLPIEKISRVFVD